MENSNATPLGENENTDSNAHIPTIFGQTCPHCGSRNLRVWRVKSGFGVFVQPAELCGSNSAEVIQKHSAVFEKSCNPITYKCSSCKKSFESLPVAAPREDILSEPCTIHFERLKNVVGAAVPQYLFLNGICLSPVSMGQTITVQTPLKHNTLFVTEATVFKGFEGIWTFEATPGAEVSLGSSNGFKRGTLGSLTHDSDFSAYSQTESLRASQQVYEQSKEGKKAPLLFWVRWALIVLALVLALGIPYYTSIRGNSAKSEKLQEQADKLQQQQDSIKPPAAPNYERPEFLDN